MASLIRPRLSMHCNMEFVASAWQRKWSRLVGMNWDEAYVRIAQEFYKRLDLALYRAPIGSRAARLHPQSAAQLRFFFADHSEAERRAALLLTHLPREAEAIIRQADEVCRHEFRLLGHEKLDYGANIAWHAAPGKRSNPLAPWFKINFLDFEAVGDHKVIWELNRHQHLVTLAKARLLSGNAAYTNELVAQWGSWQKANPYPLGINWASTLEVAFRSLSWLWVRNLLVGCSDLPASFQTRTLLALQLHGRYIERYLSTYFSPNTHLLGEAVALFFIGTLCPEIAAAERWRKLGWKIVLQESERQVLPDGVYFEQALYYHVYALDFFLHARILAGSNGFAVSPQFDSVLRKMLDVVQALSAVGPIEGFGDDDGGRVFDPQRNRLECMTDPLALGAILYGRHTYPTAPLTEESIWLFGDKSIQEFKEPHAGLNGSSRVFPNGGIYLISDFEPRPQQVMIDAGPQGIGNSGHGHADALSIRFSLDSQRILVDSGTYCYVSDGDERSAFRGTAAHNTLRVDNLDQAVAEGPFAWSHIPKVAAETWLNGKTFDYFVGSHDGYRRLAAPVVHRRSIFHVKGGLWLVRDQAEGEGRHRLEVFWHFAPGLEVAQERGAVFAKSARPGDSMHGPSIALLTDPNSEWITEIREGLVSPAYGSKQVAPVLLISSDATLPRECGVLILPMGASSEPGVFTALGESSTGGVCGYRYQTLETHEFLFFAQGGSWSCGPWSSDSKLLYCKLERGRFSHVIMVSGSFGAWGGKQFVSHPLRTEIFEWMSPPGSNTAISSGSTGEGDSVISDFEVLDILG